MDQWHIQEPIVKHPKETNESMDESETISMVTIHELYASLQYLDTPAQRFQNLCDNFTAVPQKHPTEFAYHELWLELPQGCYSQDQHKVWMELIISRSAYNSQCFKNTDPHANSIGDNYYYITALFEDNPEEMYFQIRIDTSFTIAEVMHIQRGANISGTHVRTICMDILNFINPQCVYLHDDARVKDIALRVLLPIASPEAKTWYTPDGFALCTYAPVTGQNGDSYHQAVNLIRDTTLSTLIHQPKLQQWRRRYFDNPLDKNSTIHNLAQAIYLKSKDPSETQATQDLGEFYKALLTHHPSLSLEYLEALDILYTYQLWNKTA